MKKRLLTLMLVAFVLCTMAINSFALTDTVTGQPLITNYSNWNKSYGQYKWDKDPNYQSELFYYGKCPYCNKDVTYINVKVPSSYIHSLSSESSSSYGDMKGCVAVGSYWDYNRYGFKPSNFMLYRISTYCNQESNNDLRGRILFSYINADNTYTPYVHYKLDLVSTNGIVNGGWYVTMFSATRNDIGKVFYQNAVNWLNSYNSNKLLDLYEARQRSFLLENFCTSEFPQLNTDYLYNEGFNDGLFVGEGASYEEAYKDGFSDGTIHGQKMTDFTFLDLMDSIFNSAAKFIRPVLDLGVMDITIRSFVGLLGVVYVGMLMLKVLRG